MVINAHSAGIVSDQREDMAHLTMDFGLKLKMQTKVKAEEPVQRFQRRESLRINNKLGQQTLDNNPKDIAQKMKKLYGLCMASFVN